jgi:6-phosphogluconolactonase (cycloisomerase 2 family)
MNRNPRTLSLVAVSLVCVLILAACNCAPTLRYITISPATSTISVGTTQQFTANGYYSNGAVTSGLAVTWGSSTQTVATIDQTGAATGVATGTTSITATALGITATSATLNVNQLVAIAITPITATVAAGGTQQYDAMGVYKNPDGTLAKPTDITTLVTWSATPATVGTIDNTTNIGLAAGVATGTATITAALDGVTSNSATLIVGATKSLVVTPPTTTIAVGNSAAFTVQEKWSDGTLHPPSGAVTWTSSAPAQANVISNGAAAALAAGFAVGTPTITATEGSLTGTSALTVVTGNTHYAYVPNINDLDIGVYSVNATTSPYLTPDGMPVNDPPVLPRQVIMNPNGQYLYAIGQQSYTSLYTITNGIPAFVPNSQLIGGDANWNYGVIDPYGRFIFEVDSGNGSGTYPNGTIYAFTINQTDGSITTVSGSPFTANLSSGRGLIIDHTGQYLYATNYGNNTISAYQIDQTTGALTPLPTGATIPTGMGPEIGTLDPTGKYIYVANKIGKSVSSYSIGTGGVLSSLGADTVVPGAVSPINVRVAPNNNYLYVVDNGDPAATPAVNGQLFGFALTSGVLSTTPVIGTPIATGLGPTGTDIDPTGSLIAVANSSNAGPGNISLFTIGSGGAVTTQTPVTAGNFPLFVTFFNAP